MKALPLMGTVVSRTTPSAFAQMHPPVVHVVPWAEALADLGGCVDDVSFVRRDLSVEGGLDANDVWLEGKVLDAFYVEIWREIIRVHGIIYERPTLLRVVGAGERHSGRSDSTSEEPTPGARSSLSWRAVEIAKHEPWQSNGTNKVSNGYGPF